MIRLHAEVGEEPRPKRGPVDVDRPCDDTRATDEVFFLSGAAATRGQEKNLAGPAWIVLVIPAMLLSWIRTRRQAGTPQAGQRGIEVRVFARHRVGHLGALSSGADGLRQRPARAFSGSRRP